MKACKPNMKNLKKKTDKTPLIQLQLFIFNKPACLQKYFQGRFLFIRVFSSDGHYLKQLSVSFEELSADSCPAEI